MIFFFCSKCKESNCQIFKFYIFLFFFSAYFLPEILLSKRYQRWHLMIQLYVFHPPSGFLPALRYIKVIPGISRVNYEPLVSEKDSTTG